MTDETTTDPEGPYAYDHLRAAIDSLRDTETDIDRALDTDDLSDNAAENVAKLQEILIDMQNVLGEMALLNELRLETDIDEDEWDELLAKLDDAEDESLDRDVGLGMYPEDDDE